MDNSSARKTLRLLQEKEFTLFIFTRFIVIFSLFMQTTAVGYLIYSITKDPLSLGLVGLAEVIPALGCAFFAGYFVDKMEKRTVYLYCILFYILNAALLTGLTSDRFMQHANSHTIEMLIYLAMFLSGIIRAFLAPASFSLLPLLVQRHDIPQAITWSSTAWLLGSVLGPLCGGLLMAWIGINSTLLISMICLFLALISILYVKKKAVPITKNLGILKGLAEGFRFVFRSELILAVLSLDLFAVLFGGAEALLPVYSKEILKVSEVGYGWLRSAHGMGAICLMFLLAYIPLKKNVGVKLLICVAMYGVCIILFGMSTYVWFSFFMLFFAGLFDGVSVVIRHSILQLHTPSEIKGRVSSINMMFISSSNELGAFESGLTARLMGTVPAVLFGGIMTIMVVIVTFFKAPQLRKITLESKP
ncbi:MAG: MFS transporter [Chitinophagaceae bacterium]|nr:MFS transporter [Chitinophagaceae bacterium]